MQLYDKYSFKAIYLPTIVVLSSPIINIYALVALTSINTDQIPFSITRSPKIIASMVPMLLYLVAATLVRTSGRKKQEKLLRQWDGFPSTRFLRHSDKRFSEEMKANLRDVVKQVLNINLLRLEEERKQPQEADRRISDAFALVKDWLRKNDKEAFWQKHNIDYGFYRNLWGSSWLWISFNALFVTASVVLYRVYGSIPFLCLLFLNIAITAITLALVVLYLPKSIKFSAEQYAESAWSAFYNLNQRSESL